MKRILALSLATLLVGLAVWALAQSAQQAAPLAGYAPPGALVYLEARELASLVADWNSSDEKRLWLASDNYRVFSRSRLFFRLEQAQQEFATAAGVPPDMPLVQALAGGESALAVYDIGEMQFLFITRLDAARVMENALWRASSKFESRTSAGRNYFVRREPVRGREAAFAAADGWALVATREDLLAQALALMAGGRSASLRDELWYQTAVRGGPAPGELRMTLNLPALTRTPHFRSYWIQRNITELRQYSAGLVDLRRGIREYREERRLIRPQPAAARDGAGLGRLLRLVPSEAGLIRAWSAPSTDAALAILAPKMLAPATMPAVSRRFAPRFTPETLAVSYDDDFDARISDAPPPAVTPELRTEPLRKRIDEAKVEAALLVESSRPGRDKLFIGVDSVMVLAGAGAWNGEAVRAALGGAVEGLFTVSGLGLSWRERMVGGESIFETDGLARLAVATRDRLLFVATSAEALLPVLTRSAAAPAADGPVYFAEYRHARELPNFIRVMRMIDNVAIPEEPSSQDVPRPPMFFSENLASLGRTMGRLESVSVSVRDSGAARSETVIYRLAR